ncbi:MAG: STAS domain-containing protein [Deltaproteobacteria bacterium]|nr:STAS domain-containing protein [Deltaproteobacteria bacterium]
MQASDEIVDDALLIRLEGKITGNNAPNLEQSFKTHVEEGRHKIALDFTAVEYISSAGLRVILWLAKQLKSKPGGLVLFGVQKSVMDIFKMCGFVELLPFFESREAALEKLK